MPDCRLVVFICSDRLSVVVIFIHPFQYFFPLGRRRNFPLFKTGSHFVIFTFMWLSFQTMFLNEAFLLGLSQTH